MIDTLLIKCNFVYNLGVPKEKSDKHNTTDLSATKQKGESGTAAIIDSGGTFLPPIMGK